MSWHDIPTGDIEGAVSCTHSNVLIIELPITQCDLDFLYLFKSRDPDWSLAPHEHIQNLSAVQ